MILHLFKNDEAREEQAPSRAGGLSQLTNGNRMEESTQLFGSAESIATATIDRYELFCIIDATVHEPDLVQHVCVVGSVASSIPFQNRLVFGHSLFTVDTVKPIDVVHTLPPVYSGLFPNVL
ncbi:MAG: hypothetical protein A2735_03240 [Candidatus Yanofskybacteria bacterium RIFCSPHIGHO2_01_FULL_41_21]|uniref:Uncharacterized protein n=1 Tax=Candidatus Yanofskybacteria bacterium RIFCSPHIGHO2_01_FULL_41_21 TaxID=1802660 RepID=A0A1F8EB48_9BACT|nr:MAG: hypothetical protein A2735_03240 [Candidatus Yanofskybacteria bacterium RIFCSPHIGHO2_01_FULL_41_21]